MAHTPTPWRITGKGTIRTADDWVADVHWKNKEANAAFIVRACNLHDELVEAVERCLAMVDSAAGPPNWDWLRDVLARAREA